MLPKSLHPLLPYLKRYRWGYAAGTACVFLTNGIWILFPLVLGKAADDLNASVTRHKLLVYAGLLLLIALTKGTFQFLTRWIVIGVSRDIEFDLRNDLFQKLESLSFSYYQRHRTGDIMARATNDLSAVRNLLGPAIMYTANTVVLMTGALAFMISISPRLTLYTFLPLPAASILIQYFGRRIHERFERIQAMFSDITARAQENFSGARLIRAYVQEDAEIRLFEAENQEYIRRSLKLVRLMGMLWPTLELMMGGAVVLVLLLGGREVLNRQISVGQFVSFSTYMMQLTWPIIALGYVINLFQRGTASLVRLNEIMLEQPDIKDAPAVAGRENDQKNDPKSVRENAAITGDIEFRALNFSYDGKPVLHDLNLRIPAGSSLAIVGPTGSGKTTLVSLIPRIYDAEAGSVLIDGRPIREYSLASLRKNIGFVPQETFSSATASAKTSRSAWIRPPTPRSASPPTPPTSPPTSKAFPRLRHAGRRTRHHALRRTEAAHRHRPRPDPQSQDPDPRRRALQRRHPHRRQNSQSPARRHARPHHHLYFASRLHRPQCRPHRRPAWRPDRRARHPRRTPGLERLLQRPV